MKDSYTWRANWLRSEYITLREYEARHKRIHALAVSLGSVTGAIVAVSIIYILN